MSARTRSVALVTLLGACEPPAPVHYVRHPPTLVALRLRGSADVVTSYDAVLDRWIVASAAAFAIVDPAPPPIVASPDALRYFVEREQRAAVEITARASLSDGYSATLTVHGAAVQRVIVVVRELGNRWLRCIGDLALCQSLQASG